MKYNTVVYVVSASRWFSETKSAETVHSAS